MKIKKYIAAAIFTVLLIPVSVLAVTPSAPTLNPVTPEELLITGLTQNDTEVVVYIDDEFIGMATVVSDGTESDSFNFSAQGLLEAGEHKVSVAAKNKQSLSLSLFSQSENFTVTEEISLKPTITGTAVTEEVVVVENVEQVVEEKTATEEELFDISELVSDENVLSEEDQKKNDNILRWNLGVFIFFLVAVIAWIVWVNRELKKEKEEEKKNIE